MGKVIFNSDDFGYSSGVNYGIIDAYQKGILTSTTLMANMPGFEQAVSFKKNLPNLGVGVHLTLTCGAPLLKNVNTLIDSNSQFKKLDYYHNPDFTIDWDQLYQEWNAQIQKVYRAGIVPTHLDSHHHTHSFGRNQDVVIALAKKYNLPVRCNFDKYEEVKHVDYFEPYFDDVGEEDKKKWQTNRTRKQQITELLAQLRNDEISEVMCHTAYIDQTLYNGSSFTIPRINQVEFLINSDFAKTIKNDANIELVNYGDIFN